MLVTVSSTTYDLDGSVEFFSKDSEPNGDTRRRVTRTPTTDGGVSIVDRGYSEGDRTLTYTWDTVSFEHNAEISRLVSTYPRIYVSNSFGVYLAAPELFTPGTEESTIRLLVIERVS